MGPAFWQPTIFSGLVCLYIYISIYLRMQRKHWEAALNDARAVLRIDYAVLGALSPTNRPRQRPWSNFQSKTSPSACLRRASLSSQPCHAEVLESPVVSQAPALNSLALLDWDIVFVAFILLTHMAFSVQHIIWVSCSMDEAAEKYRPDQAAAQPLPHHHTSA